MTTERINAVVEECLEIETLEEVIATYAQWVEDKTGCDQHPACQEAIGLAFERVLMAPRPFYQERGLPLLGAVAKPHQEPPVLPRVSKKYRLLKTDVTWTTKPQVQGIVRILAAHVKEGETFTEEEAVGMMEANKHLLSNTRQTCERLFRYYKGDHAEGLEAHGNIEKA